MNATRWAGRALSERVESHHEVIRWSQLAVVVAERSFRLLENAVQEVLELVLARLLVSLGFHGSQHKVDIVVDLLQFTWADGGAWDLLVVHGWHDVADLALQSAVAVCDGADRVGAGPSFLFVEDRLIGAGRGSAWVLAVEVELLASHLEVELRLVGAGAEMVRSNYLLATLAFGVLVGERSLNKVVAGVAVSVAVALESAVERLISLLFLLQRRLPLEFLESRLGSLTGWLVRLP